jgi:hypothetical protein
MFRKGKMTKDLPLFSLTITVGDPEWVDAYEKRFEFYYGALFEGDRGEFVRLRDIVLQWLSYCATTPALATKDSPYEQFECTLKSCTCTFKAYVVFQKKTSA